MVLLLYKFTIFSFFPIILENIWQRTAAAEIDQNNSDGEQFIEKVVNGEKTVFERPEYLLFTAPYKICEGECSNNEDNFVMEFPLFIGKKGLAKYTDFYRRDHQKVHSGRPNAPLKTRPTKKLFTLCPSNTCTTPTTTDESKLSTEAPTTQDADTVREESSSTTNGSTSDEKEDEITESHHDTEPQIESTQTEIFSTSNVEIESVTQINEDLDKNDTETSHTNLKLGNEVIEIIPTEIETGQQTESATSTELTIEISQNDTQPDRNDNGRINLDPSQAEENETEIESNTPGENTNNIQENTQAAEDTEKTGELELENESVNTKENMQMKESTVMSGEIHENGSINSNENTQIEENIELSGETQYGNQTINSKEITKTDEINEMTEDPQNGGEASKENIETKENTEASCGKEHADDSINAPNNAELTNQDNKFQYNPTNQYGSDNSHKKLKFKIKKTSHTDGDAYTKKLLFRPMFTAITNEMGEMCPFYVCSKQVKVTPDTDLNKLELTTEISDQPYRDIPDTDVKFNQKYSLRRGWQNEREENSKFGHKKDVSSANTNINLHQRQDQMNESEEFPSYSDDNDGNKNSNKLRVQLNEEDVFESYSNDL